MALTTLLLALVASVAIVNAQIRAPSAVMGGASSIEELAKILTQQCPDSGAYLAVGSGTGIAEFNRGAYVVGFSDQPMTIREETQANTVSKVYGKCTVPVVLSVFSFFVKTSTGADAGIQLDATQTFNIFKSGGSWATYKAPAALVSGPITRVARQDSSGTTFTIKLFWKQAKVKGFTLPIDSGRLTFSGLVLKDFSSGVCSATNGISGAITYAQVGSCDQFGKLTEVAVKNKGGKFILASTSNSVGSLPRAIPKNCGVSWSNFGAQMMFRTGAATPPIVALAYGFIRAKSLGQAGALGGRGKSALTCWLNKVNSVSGLRSVLKFYPLPSTLLTKAKAAVASVKN